MWFPRSLADAGRRLSGTSEHVLLIGPRGSGRATFARQVHRVGRPSAPFVTVECGALPQAGSPGAASSYGFWEPVGRTRDLLGQAAGGTLFLRDLDELPLEWQLDLLRAFRLGAILPGAPEEVGFDVRVIASCRPELPVRAEQGGFSAALLERIGGRVVTVTALRERPDEVLPLFRRIGARMGLDVRRILSQEPGLAEALQRHPWWGQVAELAAFTWALLHAHQEGRSVRAVELLGSMDTWFLFDRTEARSTRKGSSPPGARSQDATSDPGAGAADRCA